MLELKLNEVTKKYKDNIAVNHINATFTHGVYGLLGANGAGKTTLLRLLCDILRPDEGKILCNDRQIEKLGAGYRRYLGYLPQDFGFYPDFTAERFLLYMAALKALPASEAKRKTQELLAMVGLEEIRKKKIKTLSGGMVRRLGIAQAMLNDPEILILDEPTSGLDPKERIRFRNIISAFSRDRIVILSTHIVSDVEYIADEILLMKGGKLLQQGSVENVARQVQGWVWELSADREEAEALNRRYVVSGLKNQGDKTALRIISEDCPAPEAVSVPPTLEDVYLYYFREEADKCC